MDMNLTLKSGARRMQKDKGQIVDYKLSGISPDMSFLEMLDVLNQQLIGKGEEPVAFDHDCREGICGTCSLYINGRAHGPSTKITACQLHMRSFKDGDTIYIEPWRAKAFPVIKDLIVDRSSFDRIQQAGGFISVNTSGNTQDANAIPIEKENADKAFDAATCIGCGAVLQLVKTLVRCYLYQLKFLSLFTTTGSSRSYGPCFKHGKQMDQEGFGNCTNTGAVK